MKIAAVTIVKNEADVIGRMIESVIPLVDYAVLLDTGSSDDTIEAAKQCCTNNGFDDGRFIACKSGNFDADTGPKDFHFGDARNEALCLVPDDVDWIISIDADEVAHGNRTDLEHYLETVSNARSMDWHNVRIDAFYGASDDKLQMRYSFRRGSLFRNRPDIRFQRRVHEELTVCGATDPFDHLLPEHLLRFEHHKPVNRAESNARNLPLLQRQADEDGRITVTWFQIGQIYFERHDFVRALAFVHAYLMTDPQEWTLTTYAYMIRGWCYYHMGLTQPAIDDAMKCIGLHPHHHYGYVLAGTAYLKGNNPAMARFYLRRALEMPEPDPIFVLPDHGMMAADVREKLEQCEQLLSPQKSVAAAEPVEV